MCISEKLDVCLSNMLDNNTVKNSKFMGKYPMMLKMQSRLTFECSSACTDKDMGCELELLDTWSGHYIMLTCEFIVTDILCRTGQICGGPNLQAGFQWLILPERLLVQF